MNIDDLSKSQLLLLTLLVNFVMSIATGIVTVSLLDEAPATVTQTVNRIVEHTVETVAPSTQPAAAAASQTQQPSEEDELVSAIAGVKARTVSLYDVNNGSTTTPALAQGIYLPKSRAVVVLANASFPQNAAVVFPDGSAAPVSLSHSDATLMIYGFADNATLPTAPATTLIDPSTLKQGQAVIAITGDGSAVTGIISKISADSITTTLPDTPQGAAATDLKGELIGINDGSGNYLSAARINALLSATSTAQSS